MTQNNTCFRGVLDTSGWYRVDEGEWRQTQKMLGQQHHEVQAVRSRGQIHSNSKKKNPLLRGTRGKGEGRLNRKNQNKIASIVARVKSAKRGDQVGRTVPLGIRTQC